jgi:4-amino-4-deoxy-L-arabinose transferase-like glycosyltransferase
MREENTAAAGKPKAATSLSTTNMDLGGKNCGASGGVGLPVMAICLVGLALFALRLTAPSNFLEQDQERPAAYVLDIVKNGNWLCQRDLNGDVMSKPPFYNWLAALLALPAGRVTLFSLYAPGAAAALGTALLLFYTGRSPFGARASFFGALASMLTPAALKEFGLARTDGVFAFAVTAAALAGYQAWVAGKGWLWFWLLGAVATLTKGPLGLLLAALGFLACMWERKSGRRLPLKGSHLPGIALFLLIAGGWFLLAYHQVGKPLTDKFFGQELASAAVSEGGHRPGTLFYRPPLYYLGRAAPWSVLACLAVWRVWRRPALEPSERRLERFLCCWFLGGLFIFSTAPHQRADLLWPIMPAAALLAGREVERLRAALAHRTLQIRGRRWAAFDCAFGAFVALMLCGYAFNYFGPQARTPIVRQTLAVKTLAAQLAREPGAAFPLWHTDDPMALQIYLNTWRPRISFERAAALLRGPAPAFVTVSNPMKIEPFRKPDDPPLYTVAPVSLNGLPCPVLVLGNRPQFE